MKKSQWISIALASFTGIALIGLSVAVVKPDWLPSWAKPPGTAVAAEDAGLFCKEHGVPEKFCTLCHDELKSSLLLCKEHGNIPEDICTLCHPEVAERYQLVMCEEHGLPESFCYLCGHGENASEEAPDDGWCAAHNTAEALCVECLTDPALMTGP